MNKQRLMELAGVVTEGVVDNHALYFSSEEINFLKQLLMSARDNPMANDLLDRLDDTSPQDDLQNRLTR